MINQHCPHDPVFGYCKGEPDFDELPKKHIVTDKNDSEVGVWLSGGHCKKEKETCGFFLNHIEIKDDPRVSREVRIFKNGKEVGKQETKTRKKKSAPVQGNLFE